MSTLDTNPAFEVLLDYLRRNHGFDFTAYKRPSLMRRLQQRMQMLQISSYSPYNDYLKEHPEEFAHLFSTIEINVTSFFRDQSAWDYVSAEIIPRIIAAKSSNEPIRIWSAGCASGEETYTLAILMAEALGVEKFRERVRIYATDVDKDALNQAYHGSYLSSKVVGIPTTLRDQYFERVADRYVFRKDLRGSIIFCHHNLIQDAPMSGIDLLICRNVLIYFNTEAQTRVLMRFHFGLKDTGFLFLGKAEMLNTHTNLFTYLDLPQRVFTKVPKGHLNSHLLIQALDQRQRRAI